MGQPQYAQQSMQAPMGQPQYAQQSMQPTPMYAAQPMNQQPMMMMNPSQVTPMMAAPMMQQPIHGAPVAMANPPMVMLPIANPIMPMFDAKVVQSEPKFAELLRLAQIVGPHQEVAVEQQIRWLEACCGCEQQNEYRIRAGGPSGPDILVAREKSDTCTRLCCNPHRRAGPDGAAAGGSEEHANEGEKLSLARKGG